MLHVLDCQLLDDLSGLECVCYCLCLLIKYHAFKLPSFLCSTFRLYSGLTHFSTNVYCICALLPLTNCSHDESPHPVPLNLHCSRSFSFGLLLWTFSPLQSVLFFGCKPNCLTSLLEIYFHILLLLWTSVSDVQHKILCDLTVFAFPCNVVPLSLLFSFPWTSYVFWDAFRGSVESKVFLS